MKTIGLLTSGGDSPGMNACIRAVVRTAAANNINVMGIYYGYQGLVEGNIKPLTPNDVSNIIQRGGTILKTSRSAAFRTPEGMAQAYQHCIANNIDALITIGGDGTFKGATQFNATFGLNVMGIPGTIDKDLVGTDYTIGFDTAVNTALEAIDKIRDTAEAHDRLFFVEVMGRDAGYIALYTGIAGGAEAILIPETPTYIDALITTLEQGWKRHKGSKIVVVAEGDDAGGATHIANLVKEKFTGIETRVSILGHIQRGGNPTVTDRLNASLMGYGAVQALAQGQTNLMVGILNNQLAYTPLAQAIKQTPQPNQHLLEMARVLAL